MELSITAVSRNRMFTNALVRHAEAIAQVEKAVLHIETSTLNFDVFQLVFLDRAEDYVKPNGLKADRLFQVEVAIPGKAVDYNNVSEFIRYLVGRLRGAAEKSKIPAAIKTQITEATDLFFTD